MVDALRVIDVDAEPARGGSSTASTSTPGTARSTVGTMSRESVRSVASMSATVYFSLSRFQYVF